MCISLSVLYAAGTRADNRHVATAVTKTAGGFAGFSAGATAGAIAGSVVPVIGNVVGGFVGGMLGASYGAKGAEELTNMACDATNADWRCPKCIDWTVDTTVTSAWNDDDYKEEYDYGGEESDTYDEHNSEDE